MCSLVVIASSRGCSLCVVDALIVMVSSSLLTNSSSVAGLVVVVGLVVFGGVILVCLVVVDRVFAPVDSTVSASLLASFSLFVVDWQCGPGCHIIVIAVHVDMSHCFWVFTENGRAVSVNDLYWSICGAPELKMGVACCLGCGRCGCGATLQCLWWCAECVMAEDFHAHHQSPDPAPRCINASCRSGSCGVVSAVGSVVYKRFRRQ